MRRMLGRCPNCGGELEVTRLSCKSCETVILARYEPCRFCRLAPASLDFIERFVKNRGNLKEMERELGQSYWALRTRLNEVVQELGYEAEASAAETGSQERLALARHEILSELEAGRISAGEAAEQLARLRKTNRE